MVIVFSGPTLSPRAARELFPEALCLPPAAQGDVYRACRELPAVICLIDGYFEHQPAVTHKELLWALHNGVVVYGASSMGALRAAEMNEFGIRGWGKIYEMFAAGELEDDDEVTVVHAESDHEFLPSSEALVNIRLTLKAAAADGTLSNASADALVAHAKALFYPERQYPRILRAGAEAGLPPSELLGLERWLLQAANRLDQKAKDASTLLAHVRTGYRTGSLPAKVRSFDFPYTEAWHELRASIDETGDRPRLLEPAPRSARNQDLLEEIQLLGPEAFQQVLSAATWRALCLALSVDGDSTPPDPQTPTLGGPPAQTTLARIPEQPSRKWLLLHDLDAESHRRLLADEQRVLRMNQQAQTRVLSEIPNVLKLLGDYPEVKKRARKKRRHSANGARQLEAEAVAEAIKYYFEQRLGRPVPQNLTAFAHSTGFSSRDELVAAICREAEFVRGRK